MDLTHSIIRFRRHLRRRNLSPNTIRSYLNNLKLFIVWVDRPLEEVDHHKIGTYIDHLLRKRRSPKTINCHLNSIRRFYDFLRFQEDLAVENPVRKSCHLRMAKPLPRHLRDGQVKTLLATITSPRDRAMFMLMLRSGLRVAEVVGLAPTDFDWQRRRLYVHTGRAVKTGSSTSARTPSRRWCATSGFGPQAAPRRCFWWSGVATRESPYRCAVYKNAWRPMPVLLTWKSLATNCGTPWPPRCSMPMPTWLPSRSCSATVALKPRSATAR